MVVALGTARDVIDALTPGRPTNRATLCRRLGMDGADLDAVLADLTACGLVDCPRSRVQSCVPSGMSIEGALLLAALPADRSTRGNISLRAELLLDNDAYARAKQELLDGGYAVAGGGRGGTLARVALAQSGVSDSDEQPEEGTESTPLTCGLSPTAALILAALPKDGSTKGNIQLRSLLDIDDDAYATAKQELLDADLVRAGKGRGGTLARVEASMPEEETALRLVKREAELYRPFADHLAKDLIAEVQSDETFRFGHAFVSATPSGHKRSSGQWSRPDVTQIRVTSNSVEYLPAVEVEVSAYEIKRNVEAERLESVYEAAAQGRWAHMTNLVVELPSEEASISPVIQAEAKRLGVGLYAISRRDDGGFRIRQILDAERWPNEPELPNVDELLKRTFRDDTELRQRYKEAIHR